MTALIQVNEELLSIDSELSYSDTESTKDEIDANINNPPQTKEESSNKPSSKARMFNSMSNLKMNHMNINQVLPIEYPKDFQIIWKNVSYTVKSFKLINMQVKTKEILHNLNGSLCSGQVTAVMGPSGAGKSTFLEVLTCRRNLGVSGEIKVKDIKNVRIAYVPQNNYLMEKLTVFETMYYACKLNHSNTTGVDHRGKVEKLITRFGLENIRDTKIARCSGGQQKRLSIALELFANPNMLVLDEPTTGLDSSSCALVVKLLKDLVNNPQFPMAIVATIHQPSWAVFTEFDQVYIMTKKGQSLYSGSPNKLLPILSKAELICDRYNSPSDYIIEIAAEDYGEKAVLRIQEQLDNYIIDNQEFQQLGSLSEARFIRKTPLLKSMFILFQRSGIIYRRNSVVNILRIISIILITVWLSVMFGTEIGKVSGCPMRKLELYNIPIDKLSTLFEESILLVTQNSCCLFFGLIVGLISGMTSVVLEFPREMHIFMKEYNNGWYSCLSFYITKSLLDIPMQIIIPSIYVVYIYSYTNQPQQYFREFYLLLITILVSFVSESIGAICSAIFMKNPTAAAFIAGAVPLPMTLFGGFLVKYSRMPIYMRIVSWLSLLKYAFEGLMVTMYGFDRCNFSYNEFLSTINESSIEKPIWARYLPLVLNVLKTDDDTAPSEGVDEEEQAIYGLYTATFQAINKNASVTFERSLILSYYEIDDDNILYMSVYAMILYFVIIKVATYFIILGKLKYGS